MKTIQISDITLRECELENTSKLSFKEKQEVSKLLEKLGVDIIETGYVTDNQGDAVFTRMLAGSLEQCILSVPVSADKSSIDKAWAALSKAKKPRLNLIIPTSTIGMEYGQQIKPDALPPLVGELITYAKTLCKDVEFTADDALRSEEPFLAEIVRKAIAAGAGTITFCDCVGELLPDELTRFTANMFKAVPELSDVTTGFHIIDRLGLASASVLRAVDSGANLIKVSSNNETDTLSLEDFLNILKSRGETIGISSSLNTTSHQRVCGRLTALTGNAGNTAQRKTPHTAGSDESGKKKTGTVLPDDADIIQLRGYIQSIGYDISEDDLESIFQQYIDIAKNKIVVADDIEALIAETAGQAPPIYRLKNYVINSGSAIAATAYIEFEKDGKVSTSLSAGDGPIDAAFKAAEGIFGTGYELEDFRIHAVTSGREATGDALIKLRCDGKLYSGRGVSTDIVGASIRAYLSAVNKILGEQNPSAGS